MPIEWSDHLPPSQDCRYDHVQAETPLGTIRIEWKGWKKHDSPTCELPWPNGFIAGDDLDDVKAQVQAGWDEMADLMVRLK